MVIVAMVVITLVIVALVILTMVTVRITNYRYGGSCEGSCWCAVAFVSVLWLWCFVVFIAVFDIIVVAADVVAVVVIIALLLLSVFVAHLFVMFLLQCSGLLVIVFVAPLVNFKVAVVVSVGL